MPVSHFTIFGERGSGVSYLQHLIKTNFDIELTWDYGFKYFFGFSECRKSEHVLFLGVVREPLAWLREFYHNPEFVSEKIKTRWDTFLASEWASSHLGQEVKTDRHLKQNRRYKNIFELRYTKLKYLINELPAQVANYKLVKMEDLLRNPRQMLQSLQNEFHLKQKSDHLIISGPWVAEDQMQPIPPPALGFIYKKCNWDIERTLGYPLPDDVIILSDPGQRPKPKSKPKPKPKPKPNAKPRLKKRRARAQKKRRRRAIR